MRYQKTLSRIINELFDVRTRSDYDDFFVISKAEVEEQVKNAEVFLSAIKKYLSALE
ncbi:MAG: HEPN domain-containing protein [Oscillospiraceae bacterium]|nr:HEPN domain-containing protein [Oscillospiraceae bacterium]